MPEEVITAPSAGAESSTPAPATPTPSADGAATAAVDYSSTTDAQILDGPATTAKPEAEQNPAEPGQVDKAAQETGSDPEGDGRAIPAKWKELFKSDPELRGLFFKERAAQSKLTELTAKHAEFETASREMQEVDANFYSNDPARQEIVLRQIGEQNPAALALAARVSDRILQQTQPEQFKAINQERFVSAMKAEEFDKFFGALRDRLDANDSAGIVNIGKLLLDWGQKFGFAETPEQGIARRARELDARETSLKADGQKRDQAARNEFAVSANKRLDTTLTTAIDKAVAPLLDKSAFSDGAKARIKKEIDDAIRQDFKGNAELHGKTNAALFPAGPQGQPDLTPAAADRYHQAVTAHVDGVLQAIVKKVIDSYTSDFMKVQAERTKKIDSAASRKDVSGGASEPKPRPGLSKKDIDYGKMSDRDILNS